MKTHLRYLLVFLAAILLVGCGEDYDPDQNEEYAYVSPIAVGEYVFETGASPFVSLYGAEENAPGGSNLVLLSTFIFSVAVQDSNAVILQRPEDDGFIRQISGPVLVSFLDEYGEADQESFPNGMKYHLGDEYGYEVVGLPLLRRIN